MAPYRNNLEYLTDEFRRLDLLLERAVQDFRLRRTAWGKAQFPGLFISDQEVDELITAGREPGQSWSDTDARATELRAEIRDRVNESRRQGLPLRLPHLNAVFDLSAFETDLILLALAPHRDLRYQKLYAFLQDDVGRVYPTVDLALRLFCVTEHERVKAREYFSAATPLFSNLLLGRLDETVGNGAPPLLSRSLKLDHRIAEFLLGSDQLDPRLGGNSRIARWVQPKLDQCDLVMAENVKVALEQIASLALAGRPFCCLLYGPEGSGKKSFAEVVCKRAGRALLVLDLFALDSSSPPVTDLLQVALREALLYRSAIYLDGWQVMPQAEEGNSALHGAEQLLEDFPGIVFLGSRGRWQGNKAHRFFSVELPVPDDDLRQQLWKGSLPETSSITGEHDLVHLAGAFRFTPGQIQKALGRAETQALLREGEGYRLSLDDLLAGCRAQSSLHLVSFARKLNPQRTWQDLILPKDTLAQLEEFCQQVRQRVRVFDAWGFGRKLSLGKGLIALFSGPSGTGKTLSAEVLAKELGLDLYRVDLSCVVSKYIGETEKNLSQVFDDAQMSNAILFFDEADALFGKRSEVKDAHDRYANIEVNYLLQRVEEYEGVVILASNLSKNIDSAFIRRMRFCIELPFPDKEHRQRIWRGVFPAQAPLSEDVDFDFLARKFKLAGGNIRNIALAAAFSAADNGGTIGMEHLMLGLKREYQKLGRVCEKAEFERYYDLVR
jgi:hypothetical protein